MTAATQLETPDLPAVSPIRATDTNGNRVFLVASASGSKAAQAPVFHVVTEECGRLRCQCRAARFGHACRHQRAVTEHLLARVRAHLDCAEATTRPAPGASAPPRRNTAAFSIFK